MIVPVYRPEITVWQPQPDGTWASRCGTHTETFFTPMEDEDRVKHGDCLRTVRHGAEPAYRVAVPEGSELFARVRAWFLRTPDGKVHDAINAVIFAKRRELGFDLVLPGRPAPPPRPAPAVALKARPRGPASQLSLFGEEVARA